MRDICSDSARGRRTSLGSSLTIKTTILRCTVKSIGLGLLMTGAFSVRLPAQSPAGARMTTVRIAKQAGPATVTILVLNTGGDTISQGSGFIVRPTGIIVTNWHVMAGGSRAIVSLASGRRFERVAALDGDKVADLAIIKIPGRNLPTVATIGATPPIGSRVAVIGSPFGLAQTVSDGIVSASRTREGRELIQITVPVSPGSSGGPVLDEQGRVFAVTTSRVIAGEQLNFATPVRYALGLLSTDLKEQSLEVAFGSVATATEIVAQAAALPTRDPRHSLAGTYAVSLDRRILSGEDSSDVRHLADGHLILSERAGGFSAIQFAKQWDSTSSVYVQSVLSFHTNPAGQVVLDVGAGPMDGFQTGEGFVVQSNSASQNGVASRLEVVAKRTVIPLSRPTGSYDLRVQTAGMGLVAGKEEFLGRALTFEGEAVVVVANDSIYISMHLQTVEGGTSSVLLCGPVRKGGLFSLRNENVGKINRETVVASLDGEVGSGKLMGNWKYGVRKAWVQGSFEGLRR